MQPTFWRKTAFQIVIIASVVFCIVTAIAMFTYAGGTDYDSANPGYAFFTNYFSDLGRTRGYNDQPNGLSMALFTFALAFAGIGLALFFIGYARFFHSTRWSQFVSILGSFFGFGSALCFIGVALTPLDLATTRHDSFVLGAFLLLPLAVICYIPVLLKQNIFPARYAVCFIALALLLTAYIALLVFGPDSDTPQGLLVWATGQKIIVYASLAAIVFQSWGALKANV